MIDIKDLMIENYVLFGEDIWQIRIIGSISPGVSDIGLKRPMQHGLYEVFVDRSTIEPVPITAEWLEGDLNLYKNERSIHYFLPLPTNKNKTMSIYWSGTRWILEIAFMEVAAIMSLGPK